ncbi:MAG: SdpA family antimicrobial peptide system protein [Saprospiraceae bacterium]|nr:SdpA family antimicrobial peptide system protein [Saprospiraceae bacterium]
MLKYKYTFLFFVLMFGSIISFTLVLFTVSPFNPFKAKINLEKQVFTFVPQGWAFFTRNPREAQAQLYKLEQEQWHQVPHYHSHISNFSGLSRKASKELAELSVLKARELRDEFFIDCESNYQRQIIGCIPDTTYTVTNHVNHPLLCGEYILTLQQPIPWAWSKSINKIKMPSKVVRIKILCK